MKPGETTKPLASMVELPCRGDWEMAAILPARMPMLRTESRPDSGSMTRPLRITVSKVSSAEAGRWRLEARSAATATRTSVIRALAAFRLLMLSPDAYEKPAQLTPLGRAEARPYNAA